MPSANIPEKPVRLFLPMFAVSGEIRVYRRHVFDLDIGIAQQTQDRALFVTPRKSYYRASATALARVKPLTNAVSEHSRKASPTFPSDNCSVGRNTGLPPSRIRTRYPYCPAKK